MVESMHGWTDVDSDVFLRIGEVAFPRREEALASILALSADPADGAIVELSCGSGWLAEALLDAFPLATMMALDGSPTMLAAAGDRLARFGSRATVSLFALESSAWLSQMPTPTRLVVSSLAVHHLDAAGKQALFAGLRETIAPGGTFLLLDLMRPEDERTRERWAVEWDAETRRRSVMLTGDERLWRFCVDDGWISYAQPLDPDDPVDRPSTLREQLQWLEDAGFVDIKCAWLFAGHALIAARVPDTA
jgi:tRNA (cmo5U34)-methyltransferase